MDLQTLDSLPPTLPDAFETVLGFHRAAQLSIGLTMLALPVLVAGLAVLVQSAWSPMTDRFGQVTLLVLGISATVLAVPQGLPARCLEIPKPIGQRTVFTLPSGRSSSACSARV
jgi:hypothetical protein